MSDRTPVSKGDSGCVALYDASYSHFDDALYGAIRRQAFGEDIGQNGWLTAGEQDRFFDWLALGTEHRLLDIACGSGGPTLRVAERTGAAVHGVDIHQDGIAAARRQAEARGLSGRAAFDVADGGCALPFEDESFDAVMCIDAINHLPDRPHVLAEWGRVLKRGGRLLFTDPIVVTGPLTNEEIAIRSSIGFFLFVAPETDERLLAEAGLCVTVKEDLTEAMAATATGWRDAREKRAADLRRIEGDATFEGQQRFLDVTARIARERRLSRYLYVSVKS